MTDLDTVADAPTVAEPYFAAAGAELHLGDCREVLADLADASVDSIVTDPPYELGFMGKTWDASGIAYSVELWRECWRVLKPGGHLVAFGGTRTYHRMTVAIEDAGFEIRDSMHWIYGSGFPKGQDIAKAIDQRRDDRDEILKVTTWLAAQRDAAGWTTARMDALFGFNGMASHWTAIAGKAACVPTPEQWDRLRDELEFDDAVIRPLVAKLSDRKGSLGEAWAQREVVGERHSGLANGSTSIFLSGTTRYENDMVPVTAPATDAARQWQGWNTSLKPAHEPIVLARKSTGFNSTVANVLEYGTGALNIGGCRVEPTGESRPRVGEKSQGRRYSAGGNDGFATLPGVRGGAPAGRWPANVVFTHSAACVEGETCQADCPVAELDRQSGHLKSGANPTRRRSDKFRDAYGTFPGQEECAPARGADAGGASRFFPTFRYQAKASAIERPKVNGAAHPTVKPVALMQWLIRLVTPPGGTVLDPFAGSGTTAEACIIEGFRCVLVELEQLHAELIRARLSKAIQPSLFGEVTS